MNYITLQLFFTILQMSPWFYMHFASFLKLTLIPDRITNFQNGWARKIIVRSALFQLLEKHMAALPFGLRIPWFFNSSPSIVWSKRKLIVECDIDYLSIGGHKYWHVLKAENKWQLVLLPNPQNWLADNIRWNMLDYSLIWPFHFSHESKLTERFHHCGTSKVWLCKHLGIHPHSGSRHYKWHFGGI